MVTRLTAAVRPVNSFQLTTSFFSGLLTVTSVGGKPCAAGGWLLHPARHRQMATIISHPVQVGRRPPQTSSFAGVFGLLGSRERVTRQVRLEIGNKDDDQGRGRFGKCL